VQDVAVGYTNLLLIWRFSLFSRFPAVQNLSNMLCFHAAFVGACRTQVQGTQPSHHHPVILCPGLGSSGAYSFDLSPNVSLADYLAGRGWDVWTCELRGERFFYLISNDS
jgi:hypothetical protein